MDRVLTPQVPELDGARLAARHRHLVSELSALQRGRVHRPRVTRRRIAGATALTGVGCGIALVMSALAPTSAFASWTAVPAPAAAGVDGCPQAPAGMATDREVPADAVPVLAERRGSITFTLLTTGTAQISCLRTAGESVAVRVNNGTAWPQPAAGQAAVIAELAVGGPKGVSVQAPDADDADPATAALRSITAWAADADGRPGLNGEPFTLVHGRAASTVTAVRVIRTDGTAVTATLRHSWFTAWWPGLTAASGLEWTRADGTISNHPLRLNE